MNKVFAFAKLLRPLNLFQGAIAVLISATLVNNFPSYQKILIVALIVILYLGAGNALNDYYDWEIDKINRPDRPIPRGDVKRSESLYLSMILFLVGTLLSIKVLKIEVAIILAISLFLLLTYTKLFKMRPFIGNAVISLMLGMVFIFSTAVFKDIRAGIAPALLAFGFTFIREIVKDIQDMKGDKRVNANTIPIKYGVKTARNFAIFLTALLIIGAPLLYVLKIYGKYYLVTLILAVEIPMIFFIYSIKKDSSAKNCSILSSMLKYIIFFGLLAIYLGKF